MFGVAFDIDGVLIRGKSLIPSATSALKRIHACKVPYLFLTNGADKSERYRATRISSMFSIPVNPEQVVLSHTPMKSLVKSHSGKVLVVGGKHAKFTATNYGFDPITPQDLHSRNPHIWPFTRTRQGTLSSSPEIVHESEIEAILVLSDSWNWGLDLQVCMDVLRAGKNVQRVPIYFSNGDFEFANEFAHNRWACFSNQLACRFAQGAFRKCLETLYRDKMGHCLEYTQYGKPENVTYEFAQKLFPKGTERVFAIGDNPDSDILGANRFPGWRSVMVRTGVWKHDGHVSNAYGRDHGADYVVDDVGAAIDLIFKMEGVD